MVPLSGVLLPWLASAREVFAILTEDPAARTDVSIAEQLAAVTKVEDFMTRYRNSANHTN